MRHALFDEPLTAHDVMRSNRIQIAMLLHCLPRQVDDMPFMDVADLLAVHRVNARLAQLPKGL